MSALDNIRSPPRVRRVPASRIVPYNAKNKARRNLFGPVDHELLENELNDSIKKINDEKKEKWGFDFSKGEPVDGSNIEWININDEVTATSSSSEPVETLTFNTKAFVGVEGFKLLPSAEAPPQPVSSSPEFIKSVLNPQQTRKANETTPSSSVQKKRLLSRTTTKVKCKRKITSSPGFKDDKTQPSIQSFFKKRKHVPEPIKKIGSTEDSSPVSKKPRTSETKLSTVR
ncbi:uncharacterized protein LOC134826550 [Bolinopsis microptera]|uniref:uncharacterized protein LOC134826550 n=1 Tax=Bolinopsis microptera TaxID=2820187 RepID=UPI00307B087C